MLLPLKGERHPQPLVKTDFREMNAEISPDSRWLAYQSNESGRDEIYVVPFPNVTAGKWQVSASGGMWPLWARNGQELFYVSMGALMRVPRGRWVDI
jgi:Tol biopolymer transport system component